jgi:AraC-like DNA-binding protein/mannose-6-phosphate isomerase-like protein (cupin superfamily)
MAVAEHNELNSVARESAFEAKGQIIDSVLASLQLQGSVYCRSTLGRPWKLHFERHESPVFHAIERGHAKLTVGAASFALEAGDFVLLPTGLSHELEHPTQSEGARVPRILMRPTDACRNDVWTEKPEVTVLCGTFDLNAGQQPWLVPLLPQVLHVRQQVWLDALLHPLALEASRTRVGISTPGSSILRRLADVLFVQVLRHHLETNATSNLGWLSALRDAHLARALEAIHVEPSTPWTVATLAKRASLSRSAFAAKFSSVVGESPLEYLTRWRMSLATGWLKEPDSTLADVAQRAGYESEVAFHRAYKRVTGLTPGSVKRRE